MVGAVGVGGALGAMSRYGVDQAAAVWLGADDPYGTLMVNVVGSFGVGLSNGWIAHGGGLAAPWDSLLIAGFFGGFTTFSAFTDDTAGLLKAGEVSSASWYVVSSVGLSLAALRLGELLVPLLLL